MGEVADVFGTTMVAFSGSAQKEIGKISELVLDFSRITGAESSSIASSVGTISSTFSVAAGEVPGLIDTMTKSTVKFGIEGAELASAMIDYGPVFAAMGYNAQETAVIFGRMFEAGGDFRALVPGINAFSLAIADVGVDPRMALEQAIQLIGEATSRTDALSLSASFFGAESGARLAAALYGNSELLKDLNLDIDAAVGSTDALGEQSLTAQEKWTQAWSNMKLSMQPAIDTLQGAMTTALTWLTDHMKTLASDAPKWWAQVTAAWNSGVQEVAGGNAAIAAQGEQVAGAWATTTAKLSAMWESIKATWTSAVQALGAVWALFGDEVITVVSTLVGAIIDKITGLFDTLRGIFDTIKFAITGQWGKMWDALKDTVKGASKFIGALPAAMTKLILDTFINAGRLIVGAWDDMWYNVKLGAQTALNGLIGIIESALNGILTLIEKGINGMISMARGVAGVLKKVPGIGKLLSGLDLSDIELPRIELPRLDIVKVRREAMAESAYGSRQGMVLANRKTVRRRGGATTPVGITDGAGGSGEPKASSRQGLIHGTLKGSSRQGNIHAQQIIDSIDIPKLTDDEQRSLIGQRWGVTIPDFVRSGSQSPGYTAPPKTPFDGSGFTIPDFVQTGPNAPGTPLPDYLAMFLDDDDDDDGTGDGSSDLRGGRTQSGGGSGVPDLSGDVTVVLEIDGEDAHIWELAKEEILDPQREIRARGGPVAAGHRSLRT